MNLLYTILLGIVQGFTEWLPISSSGHLVLMQELLGIKEASVYFDVVLHCGTLAAVLIYFRKRISEILKSLLRMDFKSEQGRLLLLVILGSIPTALIGFIFHDTFEAMFSSLKTVGFAFIITGLMLYATKLRRKESGSLTALKAAAVGIMQGVAIVPGISRTGSTVSASLLLGIERGRAVEYSFLLSIPAVLGAAFYEAVKSAPSSIEPASFLVGFSAAAVVGYLSISILIKAVSQEKFHYFAYYCWTIGVLTLIISGYLR